MKFIVALIFALGLLIPSAPTVTQAADNCTFVLGFKALHDMIPAKVGNCLTNEYHNAQNGDGLQQTIGGLLVWRKADNWTAFTDGYRTWVNGPNGLQQRLNTERFAFEKDPIPPPTPVVNPYINDTRLMAICDGIVQDLATASLPYITNISEFTSYHSFTCRFRAIQKGYSVPTCYRWAWLNAISRVPYLANPTQDVPLIAEQGYNTCMAANP